MNRFNLRVDETIATLVIDEDYIPVAEEFVREARQEILEYIDRHPVFETSFKPISVSSKAGSIIQRMSDSSHRIGVGPMASVAGSIAQYVVEELVALGVQHVIFDNGGDVAMFLERPSVVGIYSGSTRSLGLGLKITTTGQLIGICTSSGTVGHSMSFGSSDASIVISNDVGIADAAATSLGNQILSEDQEHVESVLREIMREDLEGLMVIIGSLVGTCGNLPEIVKANVDYALISKA